MKALCVGHATFDTTLPVSGYPIENQKYRIDQHIECGGGPASNAAYLLAKWGVNTTFAGIVGKDYYGDMIVHEFESVGVNTKYIEQNNEATTSSSYIIANTENGSRTIITSRIKTIRKLENSVLDKADVIVIDGEHPETAKEVLLNNKDAISILDAGRVTDDTKELGKLVTYLICSKDFAEVFTDKKIDVTKKDELISIYEELKAYFKTNVIITLEDKGSFTKLEDYEIIPSIKVVPVDSTGAGDIFHGAFAYFIGKGYSLRETIKLASITGAISVTRIGSRNSIPDLNEVFKRGEVDEII